MKNFINYKKFSKPLCVLVVLQIISYLVYIYFPFEMNNQFIFGLLGSNAVAITVSIFISLGLIFLSLFFKKAEKISEDLLILLAAVISNSIERLSYGGVLDYINLFNINWFNLTDLIIVVVVVRIAYNLVIQNGQTQNKNFS